MCLNNLFFESNFTFHHLHSRFPASVFALSTFSSSLSFLALRLLFFFAPGCCSPSFTSSSLSSFLSSSSPSAWTFGSCLTSTLSLSSSSFSFLSSVSFSLSSFISLFSSDLHNSASFSSFYFLYQEPSFLLSVQALASAFCLYYSFAFSSV